MDKEIRTITYKLEERQAEDGSKIIGYAAIFDSETTLFPGLNERISKGAFSDTIIKDDVRAVFNHDPNFVLGRNTSSTLKLTEDDTGLRYEISPPDTQQARDLMTLIRRGDISQSSFAFQVLEDRFVIGENGVNDLRIIEKVKLFDVSAVTFPAYVDTSVAVRSHTVWTETKNKTEIIYKKGLWRRRLDILKQQGGSHE